MAFIYKQRHNVTISNLRRLPQLMVIRIDESLILMSLVALINCKVLLAKRSKTITVYFICKKKNRYTDIVKYSFAL